jgi:hypothetical protein
MRHGSNFLPSNLRGRYSRRGFSRRSCTHTTLCRGEQQRHVALGDTDISTRAASRFRVSEGLTTRRDMTGGAVSDGTMTTGACSTHLTCPQKNRPGWWRCASARGSQRATTAWRRLRPPYFESAGSNHPQDRIGSSLTSQPSWRKGRVSKN